MRSTQGTRVQIFGQVYHLRGDGDSEHVRQVADLVDRTMSRIADHGASTDTYRVAVLAALELADDLIRLRAQNDRGRAQASVNDRLASLLSRIDQVDEPEAEPLRLAGD